MNDDKKTKVRGKDSNPKKRRFFFARFVAMELGRWRGMGADE